MTKFIAVFFIVMLLANCRFEFALASKEPFHFTHARILEGLGSDMVTLWTELPSPIPDQSDEPLALYFYAEQGQGAAYVMKHFPGLKLEVK